MQTGFSIVTATRIRKNSPVASKVTFELLNRAKELPLYKVLENDWSAAYRLAVCALIYSCLTILSIDVYFALATSASAGHQGGSARVGAR